MKHFLILLFGLSLVACAETDPGPAKSGDALGLGDLRISNKDACGDGSVEQFGRYVGDWKIEDTQLQQDGVTWIPQKGARWIFQCLGDGVAVQDFWMPNAGGYGTNLRIFDEPSESWDITWTAKGAPGMTHIDAKQDDAGNIVMHPVIRDKENPRRITFFPPTDEGWDWAMEMSFDGGTNWTVVYKIKATPFTG